MRSCYTKFFSVQRIDERATGELANADTLFQCSSCDRLATQPSAPAVRLLDHPCVLVSQLIDGRHPTWPHSLRPQTDSMHAGSHAVMQFHAHAYMHTSRIMPGNRGPHLLGHIAHVYAVTRSDWFCLVAIPHSCIHTVHHESCHGNHASHNPRT